MGLDMYLKRANLHGYTPEQAEAANAYYSMMEHNKENPEEQYTSIQEWAGVDDSLLDMGAVEALRSQYRPTYFDFDVDKLFPMYDVFEQVGYWRKANAIHRWFVQNVQDGVDDCGTYIVTREQLEQLKAACERVLAIAQIVDGQICTGISLDDEQECRIMEAGKVVANPEDCAEILPTQGGFFFGLTDYDEVYIQDLDNTVKIITEVLEQTNWEVESVCYQASW